MKHFISILTASIMASSLAVAPGFAQGNSGSAPGQMKSDGESAKDFAPGQNIDPGSTASTGSFGTLISSIRAGKSDLSGLSDDPEVTIINVDDLADGSNRAALDNALGDSQSEIDALQTELAGLELEGLTDAQAEAAVAAQVDAEGDLTVYLD